MLALFGIYSRKYDLVPRLATLQAAKADKKRNKGAASPTVAPPATTSLAQRPLMGLRRTGFELGLRFGV